jgi:hypothetical protein
MMNFGNPLFQPGINVPFGQPRAQAGLMPWLQGLGQAPSLSQQQGGQPQTDQTGSLQKNYAGLMGLIGGNDAGAAGNAGAGGQGGPGDPNGSPGSAPTAASAGTDGSGGSTSLLGLLLGLLV